MRVLFTGGGTAGHVTPAIAIAEIIKKNYKESKIAFVGRINGEENRAITNAGYKLYTLDIEGAHRSISLKNVRVLIKAIRSLRRAMEIIREFKPDLIIGTGGYVSYPLLRAGVYMGVKTLVHESNAYPGLVTRLIAKRADRVMLGAEAAGEYLKRRDNVITVGNPTSSELGTLSRGEARARLSISPWERLVISFGGSGGSEKINNAVTELFKYAEYKALGLRHIHASGKRYYEDIKRAYPELTQKDSRLKIVPYIDNMPVMLAAADVAITRSGAMTLAELIKTKTPAILIPSPNVAANHQYKNAAALSSAGAALMLTEDKLTSLELKKTICTLLCDGSEREKMKEKMAGIYGCGCEENILKVIKDIMNEQK